MLRARAFGSGADPGFEKILFRKVTLVNAPWGQRQGYAALRGGSRI